MRTNPTPTLTSEDARNLYASWLRCAKWLRSVPQRQVTMAVRTVTLEAVEILGTYVRSRRMADVLEMRPRGHYLAREVGRLVGVSGQRIAQWAIRGYVPASQTRDSSLVFAYQDVAEAMIVHELLDRNVHPRTIRDSVHKMRDELGTAWPLQQVRLQIPPDHPQAKGKKKTIVATYKGQQTDVSRQMAVLEDVDLEEVGRYLQRGGWAARELPTLRNIEVDPDRLSGRPVVRGTRVPADTAGSLALTGRGRAILKDEFDLTVAQIEDARRWWLKVVEYAA